MVTNVFNIAPLPGSNNGVVSHPPAPAPCLSHLLSYWRRRELKPSLLVWKRRVRRVLGGALDGFCLPRFWNLKRMHGHFKYNNGCSSVDAPASTWSGSKDLITARLSSCRGAWCRNMVQEHAPSLLTASPPRHPAWRHAGVNALLPSPRGCDGDHFQLGSNM